MKAKSQLSVEPVEAILDYLRDRLPSYPFDEKTDRDLAEELVADFQDADVLSEIKCFRWYNDGRSLSKLRSVRLSLRRWVANAKKRNFS